MKIYLSGRFYLLDNFLFFSQILLVKLFIKHDLPSYVNLLAATLIYQQDRLYRCHLCCWSL